jgi:hypothetical protein
MQDVVSAADPWTPGGSRSGWAGLAAAVRVLAAVVLLGVALLIVALVNQTAASADSLPTPSADGPNGYLPSTLPALGSGNVTSPNAVSSASAGADADYGRWLARGAVVTAELPPSAAADIRLAQHRGAGEQDRGGSGTPGQDAGRTPVPHLGEAVRWGTPKVAQLQRSTGDGTSDPLPDGVLSAPQPPPGTLTVAAQAQPPSSTDPSPPSTYRSLSFYLFTNGILQQAEDLRGLVVGDRKEKDLGTQTLSMVKSFADRATSINKRIASARELAGATSIEEDVTVADAPRPALDEAETATRDLRNLSRDAKYVAQVHAPG